MFQRIMVPLDGSELAESALSYALPLATATHASLHLVQVVDLLPHTAWAAMPVYVPNNEYEKEMADATAYLEALHTRIPSSVDARVVPLSGDVTSTLLEYERTADIDLVVMSSHGRSGLARIALGSVSETLLHRGTCPVLIVRAMETPLSMDRVIVPLDGSPLAETALHMVDELGSDVVRKITLLRVISTPDEWQEAQEYLTGVARHTLQGNFEFRSMVALGDPAQVIGNLAGPDTLVVMVTHGRSGLTRLALGSVAARVAHSNAMAMMLLRARTSHAARQVADQPAMLTPL